MDDNQSSNRRSYVLPASILIAAVLVSGALVYSAGGRKGAGQPISGKELTVADVSKILGPVVQDLIVLGEPKAPVKIIEFADFQCPFCGKFHRETAGQIREEYIKTGKASMIIVDLAFLGQESVAAANAAHCAGEQGKYWTYHDFLFDYLWENYYAKGKNGENVGAFSVDNLKSFAKGLGLETSKFDQCLDSQKYTAKVDKGYETAQAVLGGRLSTPSISINGKLIQGAQPYAVFKAAIEEALKNS